jgi:hypothetical protein
MSEKIKTEMKPWQKPELIVLVRSKLEEPILATKQIKAQCGKCSVDRCVGSGTAAS